MDSEEEKRREEENKRFLKRLIDSEAETRTDLPAGAGSKEEEQVDPNATTKASPARRTPTPPPRIELDKDNMPLPRRVSEVDMEGTRVSPVAYEPSSRPRNAQTRLAPPVYPPAAVPPMQPPITNGTVARRSGWGSCLIRLVLVTLFGIVMALIIGGSVALYEYY